MPAGDGTGPWGGGPMTGRGVGLCAGYPTPGFMNAAPGRGRGRGGRWGWGGGWHGGWGGGRRWRHGWAGQWSEPPIWRGYPPARPVVVSDYKEQELEALKQEAEYMTAELTRLQQRIQELSPQADSDLEAEK